MVKPVNPFHGKNDEPTLLESRTFRSDVRRWMEQKNKNGEWIIPIWQD